MSIVRTVQPQLSKALYFDGVDDRVVIALTVYGWQGITVQEWIYPFHPKANMEWSKFSMIGDFWTDYPSAFYRTDYRYDYTWLAHGLNTRGPDGTRGSYVFSFIAYRNMWVNVAWRFSLADRVYAGYINGAMVRSLTIPSTEYTVLEWNPDTATYPHRYRQFVLGANVLGGEHMKMMQGNILVYSRALTDSEITFNYNNPNNPVRDGLALWLDVRTCDVSKNICYDLSGNNNHGTIYGAQVVTLPGPVRAGGGL